MASSLSSLLFDSELTPTQRIFTLWGFILVGLVIAVQASQTQTDNPLAWTKLTSTSRPYWFAIYALEGLLFITGSFPILLKKMEAYSFGYEEKILNSLWIGLVGVETLLVVGVVVRNIMKRLAPATKQKAS